MGETDKEAFYKSLPRKRMAAGVLFFDDLQRVLLVKPSYKEGWGIPGGIVDRNESPLQGALREVKEELNLSIPEEKLSLVCLGYTSENGVVTEALQFTFYVGLLSSEQIQNISLQEEELLDYAFVEKEAVAEMLSNPLLCNRVRTSFEAIEKETFYYLER